AERSHRTQRNSRIELRQCFPYTTGDGLGARALSSHENRDDRIRHLRDRDIELRDEILAEGQMPGVSDDANDLSQLWRLIAYSPACSDPAADRITSRKVLLRKALVDDDDRRRLQPVAASEKSAPHQRNAHRLKVVGTGETRHGNWLTARRQW